jgi:L-methionine (R)-S-oxide reductase
VCAALKQTFQWWWVGVYWVVENVLVLGPFQGPVACTRIQYGKGVCGKAWQQEATILVPDVEKFEGHIACSSLSRSEIVIPIIKNNIVIGVLDVDSQWLHHFDETDAAALQDIAKLISDLC